MGWVDLDFDQGVTGSYPIDGAIASFKMIMANSQDMRGAIGYDSWSGSTLMH